MISNHVTNVFKNPRISFQDRMARIYKSQEFSTKNITIEVCGGCQLKCTYCYQTNKTSEIMSLETGKKVIDKLFEMYEHNDPYINSNNSSSIILEFIGGEPFIAIDLISELCDYFNYKAITLNHVWAIRYMISITTNGIMYFDERVQNFIEKHKNRLSLSISIDGSKELHDSCRVFPDGQGSYDIAVKAAMDYMKRYGNIGSKATFAPSNISYVYDAIVNFINLGYVDIFANCVFEEGWDLSHSKIFYSELKKLADYLISNDLLKNISVSLFDDTIGHKMHPDDNQNWCGGTGKMLGVDPNGLFYPCLRYMPTSLGEKAEPLVIGSCEEGVACTKKQQDTIEFLNSITRKSQSTEECFNCPIASGCAWCSAYNYEKMGSVNKRATFICVMHKARVLANSYFFNTLYRKLEINERYELDIPKEWALEIIDENEYNKLIELSK